MLSYENPCVTHAQQSQVLRFRFDVCKACAALLAADDPDFKPPICVRNSMQHRAHDVPRLPACFRFRSTQQHPLHVFRHTMVQVLHPCGFVKCKGLGCQILM